MHFPAKSFPPKVSHQKFPTKGFLPKVFCKRSCQSCPPKVSRQKFPAKSFPPKVSRQKFPAKSLLLKVSRQTFPTKSFLPKVSRQVWENTVKLYCIKCFLDEMKIVVVETKMLVIWSQSRCGINNVSTKKFLRRHFLTKFRSELFLT